MYKRKKSNIIGGIIGAVLGSLIGVAVWVLISQAGYISALAGLLMVVCAMQGYKLFGRALDTKGIIISCLVSIAMVLVAEHLSLAVEIYKTYDTVFTHMTFMEAVQSVPEFMEYDEIKDAVVYDLIMGYLLMVVGAASTVFEAFKKSRSTVETNELQNGNEYGNSQQWMQ